MRRARLLSASDRLALLLIISLLILLLLLLRRRRRRRRRYADLPTGHRSSHHTFIWEHFYSKVDILKKNAHVLDGTVENAVEECKRYEDAVEAAGGLQLIFTGVDEDGTIGCNEPGSSLLSKTRAKTMAYSRAAVLQPKFERTKGDNHFTGVPTTCLTMGIDTLMKAKQVRGQAGGGYAGWMGWGGWGGPDECVRLKQRPAIDLPCYAVVVSLLRRRGGRRQPA